MKRIRVLLSLLVFAPFCMQAADLAVVKYSKGDMRVTIGADSAVVQDLKQSDIVASGRKIQSGDNGKAVLRFLSDQSFLEVRPKTIFHLRRVRSNDKRIRRITVDVGEVILGVKKKTSDIQCENLNTTVSGKGRYSFVSNDKGVATMVVQEGEITVQNRPKDITAQVRAGQKAVSDEEGIRVSDAADTELQQVGLRQNTLELDFKNPQTDEFTTLEIEYETDF